AALAIEYVGKAVRFYTPGLGPSGPTEWDIEGGHLAERCALFVIIALGESVLATGANFSEAAWTWPTLSAFLAAFIGTIAMWWIYFDRGVDIGVEKITEATDPGSIGLAFTYCHLPIVAGIILWAVADELVLAHPTGPLEMKTIISVVGAPILY